MVGKKWYSSEDSAANILGFIMIAAGLAVTLSGADFAAFSFRTWRSFTELTGQVNGESLAKLARTFIILAVLFTTGAKMKGENALRFFAGFTVLFALSVIVRLISAEYEASRYLEWAFFALFIGLVVANTTGVPDFVKPAVQTEYYIKTGLVVMGFSVLFSNIVNFGLYGLAIAWGVTPVVIIFMWYFGRKVLKIDNDPFVITIASATSVCGTSAAIATAAASDAKKNDLSLAVSISIVFTVIMMVFEPVIIRASGLGELMGGALIGGTVDSTGAVTVAGTALGRLGQTTAVLVKSIQNILIGFIAFAVAVFFTSRKGGGKASASEIWTRLPKFILGFFAASLIASFIIQPVLGRPFVNSVNKLLDQYKNWAFVLAFTSIGLSTNFRELRAQASGGKPLVLYVVGQLFNIVLTFAVVYVALSGRFFPLPVIAQ
ncbi:MAG: putative sulfate exporter family transporter [Synergistaceae bacterium]|nr:putative sulfate exporter family transporter [Synergistaceae bacterium]